MNGPEDFFETIRVNHSGAVGSCSELTAALADGDFISFVPDGQFIRLLSICDFLDAICQLTQHVATQLFQVLEDDPGTEHDPCIDQVLQVDGGLEGFTVDFLHELANVAGEFFDHRGFATHMRTDHHGALLAQLVAANGVELIDMRNLEHDLWRYAELLIPVPKVITQPIDLHVVTQIDLRLGIVHRPRDGLPLEILHFVNLVLQQILSQFPVFDLIRDSVDHL